MDMLVPLYRLPADGSVAAVELEKKHSILIRAVYPFERSLLRDFIQQHFTRGWADEWEMTFRHMPPSVLIAVLDQTIVGFAAYDATFNGFFGPTGVEEAQRGKGIGKALLLASLDNLRRMGYAYAVVGSVSSAEFYAKMSPGRFRLPIPDPGPYQRYAPAAADLDNGWVRKKTRRAGSFTCLISWRYFPPRAVSRLCGGGGFADYDRIAFLQAGRFAGAVAEVIQLRAADAALAFYFQLFDFWRVERENTFDAFVIHNAADGERLVDAVPFFHDHGAGENLDTFLVPFDNSLVDIDNVADIELRRGGLEMLALDMGHEWVLHTSYS